MDRMVDVSDNDGRRPSVYCPRCRQSRRREEWRRVFRHLRSGSENGTPVEVLRHKRCDEIVYVSLCGVDGEPVCEYQPPSNAICRSGLRGRRG